MTQEECKNQLALLAELGMDVQPRYMCPFCLCYFDDTALISKEDAPQDSLGGSKIALTCKECNNKFGWQIDCHLINSIIIDEESELPENLESKIEILSRSCKGKTIRAILKDEGNILDFYLLPDKNDPKVLDAEWKLLESEEDHEVVFSFPRITKKVMRGNREAALLKNAYVILFSYFGYSFLLNPFYDKIREQLEKPLEDVIISGLASSEGALGDVPDGVYVSDEMPLRGFLVTFTLKRRWKHHYCVFIPAISNGYDAAIEKLRGMDAKDGFHVCLVEKSSKYWKDKNKIQSLIEWVTSKNKPWE